MSKRYFGGNRSTTSRISASRALGNPASVDSDVCGDTLKGGYEVLLIVGGRGVPAKECVALSLSVVECGNADLRIEAIYIVGIVCTALKNVGDSDISCLELIALGTYVIYIAMTELVSKLGAANGAKLIVLTVSRRTICVAELLSERGAANGTLLILSTGRCGTGSMSERINANGITAEL